MVFKMVFNLNNIPNKIDRIPSKRLIEINWKEKNLQKLLFDNIEKIFDDQNLLLIMQSHAWQEEPDFMAIDEKGDLYIFELKAWESQSFNLLQALRYGQIYGQYSYGSLNQLYKRDFPENEELIKSLNKKFEIEISENDINRKQHFIIITNGLDYKTREAILYWQSQGLDTKSWIYRLYEINGTFLFEINKFELKDDPFSDVEEGYYILNTNISNSVQDDEDMIKNKKAAAYFDPWKRNIEKLKKGNIVFLYRSGHGIVAYGIANGKLEKANYQGNNEHKDEEYFMKLDHFKLLKSPLSARNIKQITGINHRFMSTMFNIDKDSGKNIIEKAAV